MPEHGTVEDILRQLQLASVDRLVREARRLARERTRAEVLAELRGLGTRVRWFGRSIVLLVEARR
jgi:hypothetical protein